MRYNRTLRPLTGASLGTAKPGSVASVGCASGSSTDMGVGGSEATVRKEPQPPSSMALTPGLDHRVGSGKA